MTGKILFFNANDGNGIIITSTKEKIDFNVQVWDDFDTMPSLGLEVCFKFLNDEALEVVSLENYVESDEDNSTENSQTTPDKEDTPKSEIQENTLEEDTTTTESEDEQVSSQPKENEEDTQINTNEETSSQEESESSEDTDSNEEKSSQENEEDSSEHFESDDDVEVIDSIEDVKEEIGPREESVTVTLNLSHAVTNYFNIIKYNIDKRESYKKVAGRLEYLTIKRFLWTTFNNLSEIDLHIITPKIKALSDDLKAMASVYDDYIRKTKYPPLAYAEVFLSCQAEYLKIKEGAEKTIERLNQLKGSEKHVGGVLKIKKEELDKNIQTEEFDIIKEEFKSLNGAYVDIVHMMAELDERYKHDMALLTEFEKEYRDDFYELFKVASVKYKKSLVEILSAQAFMLDEKLWEQAKTSKAVKAHFHKAGINGEFNTKAYLKYYLDTQDTTKATGDTKKLFELYDYLTSLQKEHIMIVVSSVEDAMDYETDIKKLDKAYEVKAFIDEKSALKWALKHSVKVLVVEDQLARMRVNIFLKYYKKYILVIPKIILLGNSKDTDEYAINKLLSKGVSPRVIAQNVKELIINSNS